jgi:hypothetical protein
LVHSASAQTRGDSPSPKNSRWTRLGLQQTGQSSTYRCSLPPEGSSGMTICSPQVGQTYEPSPPGRRRLFLRFFFMPIFYLMNGGPAEDRVVEESRVGDRVQNCSRAWQRHEPAEDHQSQNGQAAGKPAGRALTDCLIPTTRRSRRARWPRWRVSWAGALTLLCDSQFDHAFTRIGYQTRYVIRSTPTRSYPHFARPPLDTVH